jgi:undecaprenyl-diphosphatase
LTRTALLVIVATLPLVPDKLFFMKAMEDSFQNLTVVGVGFLITAAALLVTARLKGGTKGPLETTWLDALLIGVAQAFAPLPGVSRSGLTIAMALALGLSRTWAVGFSLLIAAPAIGGAVVFKLKEAHLAGMTTERIEQIVVATALAGVIGYLAISWLVRIVRRGWLWYFSVYLIVLGLSVLAVAAMGWGRSDAGRARASDGAVRRSAPGPGAGARFDAPALALDRADRPGADAGGSGTGPARGRPGLPGLDVG